MSDACRFAFAGERAHGSPPAFARGKVIGFGSPRSFRAVLALATMAALLLAGCASLDLRNPPRIDVVGVALDRIEGPDAYFSADVLLANQVSGEIVIEALQGTLAIEGETVAQAALVNAPIRLPANGTVHATMAAHTGMDAVLRAVAAAMRRGATAVAPGGRPSLHYTIDGSATLAGGARLPFRRSGEIGERRP